MKTIFAILSAVLCAAVLPAAEATVNAGSSFEITIVHDGGILRPGPNGTVVLEQTTFAYQWLKDGHPIEGETAKTYRVAVATHADVGNYTLRVTNSAGQVVSNIAAVSILVAPSRAETGINTATPAPAPTGTRATALPASKKTVI